MRIMLAGVAVSILVLSGVGVAGVSGHLQRSKAQKQVDTSCDACGVVVSLDGKDLGPLLGPVHPNRTYLRMSDGSLRSVPSRISTPLKVGDHVRLEDGQPGG